MMRGRTEKRSGPVRGFSDRWNIDEAVRMANVRRYVVDEN